MRLARVWRGSVADCQGIWGRRSGSGQVSVRPYKQVLSSYHEPPGRINVELEDLPKPQFFTFTASPRKIRVGGSGTLQWETDAGGSLEVRSPGGGYKAEKIGSLAVQPLATTIYKFWQKAGIFERLLGTATVIVDRFGCDSFSVADPRSQIRHFIKLTAESSDHAFSNVTIDNSRIISVATYLLPTDTTYPIAHSKVTIEFRLNVNQGFLQFQELASSDNMASPGDSIRHRIALQLFVKWLNDQIPKNYQVLQVLITDNGLGDGSIEWDQCPDFPQLVEPTIAEIARS